MKRKRADSPLFSFPGKSFYVSGEASCLRKTVFDDDVVGGAYAVRVIGTFYGRARDGVFDIARAEVFRRLDIGKSLCKNTAFTLDFAGAHAFFGDVYDARHAAGFYVVFTIYRMTNNIIHFILRNNFFQMRQKYTAKSSKT